MKFKITDAGEFHWLPDDEPALPPVSYAEILATLTDVSVEEIESGMRVYTFTPKFKGLPFGYGEDG